MIARPFSDSKKTRTATYTFRHYAALKQLVVKWRRLSRFPAKMTLVHARALFFYWSGEILYFCKVTRAILFSCQKWRWFMRAHSSPIGQEKYRSTAKWGRVSCFPAKMTLVHARALFSYWAGEILYYCKIMTAILVSRQNDTGLLPRSFSIGKTGCCSRTCSRI